jgi:hypothetical protein
MVDDTLQQADNYTLNMHIILTVHRNQSSKNPLLDGEQEGG